jgi:ABC-type dipeptide/oligopeptide/nickel transport system permease component
MKNTLQLVLIAQILVIFFAVIIGVYSAIRQYSGFDYTMTTFSFLGLATPCVLAGADGPGRRGPDLRTYRAPVISRSRT